MAIPLRELGWQALRSALHSHVKHSMCLGPLRQRSLKLSYDALPRPASGLAVIVPRKLNVEDLVG